MMWHTRGTRRTITCLLTIDGVEQRHNIAAHAGDPSRWSVDRSAGQGPRPVVKACASAHERGQVPVNGDANTNDIIAHPAGQRRLNRAGAGVTVEAMGCAR